MKVFRGFAAVKLPLASTVITIGNFDGVHRGHQVLLNTCVAQAKANGLQSLVYTFEPHPAKILNPALAPLRITPESEKTRLLAELGLDIAVIEPFTPSFASMTAEAFIRDVVLHALGAKVVVIGHDFTFGKGGVGNLATLHAVADLNIEVIAPQRFSGIVASSTKVREFILEGKVDAAAMLLGRPYTLAGQIVRGQQRGRTIGFPTANLETDQELLPRFGVYATWATLANGHRVGGVTNVGLRPTVASDQRITIETFLFDFADDLYGQAFRLEFIAYLRPEQRFANLELLKAQIVSDTQAARAILEQ